MGIREQILILIQQDKDISYNEMAKRLNKSRTTVMRNIKKLKELNKLTRIGSDKSGYWKIDE